MSAVALLSTANAAFAAAKSSSHGASTHHAAHRAAARFFHHHRKTQAAVVWGDEGFFYGPTGGAVLDVTPSVAGAGTYTNTNDIPWDWAHRYPPLVAPSQRPYVATCGAETVTVPDGHGGSGQVNVIRCY
jgi:hypothetical protein